jgi:hypothetical protein
MVGTKNQVLRKIFGIERDGVTVYKESSLNAVTWRSR